MKKLLILATALIMSVVNSATFADSVPAAATTTTAIAPSTTTPTASTSPEQTLGPVVLFPGITSQGARRAEMFRNVQFGRASVSGVSVEYGSGYNTSAVFTGNTPGEIMTAIVNYQFKFPVSNPKDTLYFNISLSMRTPGGQEYELFYGSAPVAIQKDANGNLFVTKPIVKMWPNNRSTIFVGSDVTAASLFYYDDNGFQWEVSVDVYNGYMQFDETYAGHLGRITLWKKDGSSKLVDIKTGREIIPQNVTGGIGGFLVNYMQASDSGLVDPVNGTPAELSVTEQIIATSDNSDAPVALVQLGKARGIRVYGSELQNGPTKYSPVVTAQGPSGQVVKATYYQDNTGYYYLVPANEAGKWWISFEYPKGSNLFGVDDVPQYPYYYGGKG